MKRLLALLLALLLSALPAHVQAHTGVYNLTNEFRVSRDRPALRESSNLNRLARYRAREIYYRGFEHQFWWLNQTKCSWGGENIGFRRPATITNKARWFVESWKDSYTHRRNMLRYEWDLMGSAIFIAPDGGMYGVQLFCAR